MIQGTIISNGNTNPDAGYEAYPDINEMSATTVAEEPTPTPSISEGESAEDLTSQFKAMFDALTDSIPQNTHQAKSSKNLFKQFSSYIGSDKFKDDVNEKAEKYKVPKKQIAKNFFLKVLGIIGDILGIVVNTVTNIIDTAVYLLSTLLHGAVTVINKVGNGLVSIVTLNQTNMQTA